jgi:peroxiredoxin
MQQILGVSSILLWAVLLGNVILTLALVRKQQGASPSSGGDTDGPAITRPAPDFAAETLQGVRITLADYAGRAVVFLFVRPGCGPCREGLPTYERLAPQAAHAGVELVLVIDADHLQTREFVENYGVSLTTLIAPNDSNSFYRDYTVRGTPTFCLIDSEGIVRSVGYPGPNSREWQLLTTSWGDSINRFAPPSSIEHTTV